MSSIDVAALRAAQDDHDARTNQVLEKSKRVYEGLIEQLSEFTSAAIATGLRGVTLCRSGTNRNEHTATVNKWNLVLNISSDANRERFNGQLIARICIHLENHRENPLVFDVLVFEKETRCVLREARQGELSTIDDGTDSKETGRLFANHIIERIYSYQNLWALVPTLEQWRDRDEGRPTQQTIGFLPSQVK